MSLILIIQNLRLFDLLNNFSSDSVIHNVENKSNKIEKFACSFSSKFQNLEIKNGHIGGMVKDISQNLKHFSMCMYDIN